MIMDNQKSEIEGERIRRKRDHSGASNRESEKAPVKKPRYHDYLNHKLPQRHPLSPKEPTATVTPEQRSDESLDSPTSPSPRKGPRERTSQKDFQTLLQINYKMLKEKMDSSIVAELLSDQNVVDRQFMDSFKKLTKRRERNDLLIKFLHKNPISENSLQHIFLECLNKSGQADFSRDLVGTKRKMLTFDSPLPESSDLLKFIKDARDEILLEVDPKQFLDDLVVTGYLTLDEHDEICSIPKRRARAIAYLDKIMSAGETATKLIVPLVTNYSAIYSNFKQSSSGKRNYEESANLNPGPSKANEGEGTILLTFNLTSKCQPVAFATTPHDDPASQIKNIERLIVSNFEQNRDLKTDDLAECLAKLQRVEFSSVKIYLKALSHNSLQRLIEYSRSGKALEWILSTLDEKSKEKFAELQPSVAIKVYTISESDDFEHACDIVCLCHLNKHILTKHFKMLRTLMRGSRKIASRFLEISDLNEQTAAAINQVVKTAKVDKRNGKLLKILLEETLPDVCYCILEEEIIKHGGHVIIRHILEDCVKDKINTVKNITVSEIQRYKDVLMDELEPRWFLKSLEQKQDKASKDLVEKIFKSSCRFKRIGPFMKYLLKASDMKWFTDVLRIQNEGLLNMLTERSSKHSGILYEHDISRLKHATKLLSDEIVDEIDTSNIKLPSKDELPFSSKESRSNRASAFCSYLINASEMTFRNCLDAMASAGYETLRDEILTLTEEGPLRQSYRCPKIIRQDLLKKAQLVFTTTLDKYCGSKDTSNESASSSTTFESGRTRRENSVLEIVDIDLCESEPEDDVQVIRVTEASSGGGTPQQKLMLSRFTKVNDRDDDLIIEISSDEESNAESSSLGFDWRNDWNSYDSVNTIPQETAFIAKPTAEDQNQNGLLTEKGSESKTYNDCSRKIYPEDLTEKLTKCHKQKTH